jgi:hypothetical protein
LLSQATCYRKLPALSAKASWFLPPTLFTALRHPPPDLIFKETTVRTPSVHVLRSLTLLFLFIAFSVNIAHAQTPAPGAQRPAPKTAYETFSSPVTPIVKASEMKCGGFIEFAPRDYRLEIVGGEQEQEQRVYTQGDFIFVNAGSDFGLRSGEEFVVIRPRGQFTSDFTRKDGFLGVYTQEVARLRITEVRERVSVAQITSACETVLNGDLLRGSYSAVAPAATDAETLLERFIEPEGKTQGRIVLARDGRELLSRNQVVFIDLGAEDNVKAGDRLTIFRKIGTGNITDFRDEEVARSASGGFESEEFRGGKFGIQAQRAKRPNNTGVFGGPTVKTPEIKNRRPRLPRKVLGEIVITDVQRRAATAVITRITQEVHTGDYVVVQ